MSSRAGFTLLEVLVALLLLTVGVLGLSATMLPVITLSTTGRAQGRIAQLLESRLDHLRAELRAAACAVPASGSLQHPDGTREAWSASGGGGMVEVHLEAGLSGPKPVGPDSVVSSIACP
jgi:prepilin-type N-terminal cleavage/methylation domain-containing protein